MRREDDRFLLAHAADELAGFVFLVGVQAVGRFVEHEDVRVVQNRLRQAGAVLVTLGEGVGALVDDRLQEAHLDGAIHGLLARLAAQAAQFRAEAEKAVHRHVRVGGRVLGQVADEFLGRDGILQHVMAADGDAAGRGRDEAREHAHGGGLARAVGPEEAEDLAPFERERDPGHGPFRAEMFFQVFDFYHVSCSVQLSPMDP